MFPQIYDYCENPEEDIKILVRKNENINLTLIEKPKYSRFKIVLFNIFNRVFRVLKIDRRLKKKDIYDILIEKYHIDIIHTPFQSIVKKPNVKSITTLHDVQELYFPQFFSSQQRAYRAVKYKKAIDLADIVIVSYEHVKNDIIKFFDKSQNEIRTILLDMEDLWFNKLKETDIGALNRFNLPTSYLLYPAATWEHKNHLKLLEAIKKLDNSNICLVCTGAKKDYFKDVLKPYIVDNELEKQVSFLGIISDEELFQLYQNCRAVVVPTIYEAGSFPLMESILMEIPVICSNATSLPETIGDSNFVFNPFVVEEISEKIEKIYFDDSYREANTKLLKVQSEKLRYNNAAFKFYETYKDLIK